MKLLCVSVIVLAGACSKAPRKAAVVPEPQVTSTQQAPVLTQAPAPLETPAPQPEKPTLIPVQGAFGFTLGAFGRDYFNEPIYGPKPFSTITVATIGGKVCGISVWGYSEGYEAESYKKAIIATLQQKYGEREPTFQEHFTTTWHGTEEHYFGTTNRLAYLRIDETVTNASFMVEYRDASLMESYLEMEKLKSDRDQQEKQSKLSGQL